jgi:hypothetical protein
MILGEPPLRQLGGWEAAWQSSSHFAIPVPDAEHPVMARSNFDGCANPARFLDEKASFM